MDCNTQFAQTLSIKAIYKLMSFLFLINCTLKKNSTQELINWDVCTSFECWFQQTNNKKVLYDIKKLPFIWLNGVMILRLCKKISLLFKETCRSIWEWNDFHSFFWGGKKKKKTWKGKEKMMTNTCLPLLPLESLLVRQHRSTKRNKSTKNENVKEVIKRWNDSTFWRTESRSKCINRINRTKKSKAQN